MTEFHLQQSEVRLPSVLRLPGGMYAVSHSEELPEFIRAQVECLYKSTFSRHKRRWRHIVDPRASACSTYIGFRTWCIFGPGPLSPSSPGCADFLGAVSFVPIQEISTLRAVAFATAPPNLRASHSETMSTDSGKIIENCLLRVTEMCAEALGLGEIIIGAISDRVPFFQRNGYVLVDSYSNEHARKNCTLCHLKYPMFDEGAEMWKQIRAPKVGLQTELCFAQMINSTNPNQLAVAARKLSTLVTESCAGSVQLGQYGRIVLVAPDTMLAAEVAMWLAVSPNVSLTCDQLVIANHHSLSTNMAHRVSPRFSRFQTLALIAQGKDGQEIIVSGAFFNIQDDGKGRRVMHVPAFAQAPSGFDSCFGSLEFALSGDTCGLFRHDIINQKDYQGSFGSALLAVLACISRHLGVSVVLVSPIWASHGFSRVSKINLTNNSADVSSMTWPLGRLERALNRAFESTSHDDAGSADGDVAVHSGSSASYMSAHVTFTPLVCDRRATWEFKAAHGIPLNTAGNHLAIYLEQMDTAKEKKVSSTDSRIRHEQVDSTASYQSPSNPITATDKKKLKAPEAFISKVGKVLRPRHYYEVFSNLTLGISLQQALLDVLLTTQKSAVPRCHLPSVPAQCSQQPNPKDAVLAISWDRLPIVASTPRGASSPVIGDRLESVNGVLLLSIVEAAPVNCIPSSSPPSLARGVGSFEPSMNETSARRKVASMDETVELKGAAYAMAIDLIRSASRPVTLGFVSIPYPEMCKDVNGRSSTAVDEDFDDNSDDDGDCGNGSEEENGSLKKNGAKSTVFGGSTLGKTLNLSRQLKAVRAFLARSASSPNIPKFRSTSSKAVVGSADTVAAKLKTVSQAEPVEFRISMQEAVARHCHPRPPTAVGLSVLIRFNICTSENADVDASSALTASSWFGGVVLAVLTVSAKAEDRSRYFDERDALVVEIDSDDRESDFAEGGRVVVVQASEVIPLFGLRCGRHDYHLDNHKPRTLSPALCRPPTPTTSKENVTMEALDHHVASATFGLSLIDGSLISNTDVCLVKGDLYAYWCGLQEEVSYVPMESDIKCNKSGEGANHRKATVDNDVDYGRKEKAAEARLDALNRLITDILRVDSESTLSKEMGLSISELRMWREHRWLSLILRSKIEAKLLTWLQRRAREYASRAFRLAGLETPGSAHFRASSSDHHPSGTRMSSTRGKVDGNTDGGLGEVVRIGKSQESAHSNNRLLRQELDRRSRFETNQGLSKVQDRCDSAPSRKNRRERHDSKATHSKDFVPLDADIDNDNGVDIDERASKRYKAARQSKAIELASPARRRAIINDYTENCTVGIPENENADEVRCDVSLAHQNDLMIKPHGI